MIIFSGGTGTPKLLDGLKDILPPEELTVVVNTAEDLWVSGNLISPDLDTVLYLFSDQIDRKKWWGIENDTFRTYERMQELAHSGHGLVIAVWHGYTLLPVYYCRRDGLWALTSLSRDGELLTRILRGLGYNILRGSTRRGGIRAALSACREIENGCTLAITPDGPLGPALKVQAGTVFIAKKTGCPVIPLGVAVHPGLRAPTWDRYLLPCPFARCALFFGEPVCLSSEAAEAECAIESAIEDAHRQAEQMLAGH